ncbi:peptidase domain-containing ABC transporter, partial [Escherichia coli]|nr:peptidase domain-containing ABC transporter [Escherichia coli]
GDVVMAKRDYEISDETQPFSFGFVTALLFRERRILRDVALAALILGFMGLAPIMFWRLLSDKVIFYKAYNTFYVLCLAMFVVIM